MTQLNYRENLNMKFKAYNGGLRVFKNYEINDNNINIYFSNFSHIHNSNLEILNLLS